MLNIDLVWVELSINKYEAIGNQCHFFISKHVLFSWRLYKGIRFGRKMNIGDFETEDIARSVAQFIEDNQI